MDQGLSWYPSDISYATSAENRVAALALVYHATSTGAEKPMKDLMTKIFDSTPDYTPGAFWAPPRTWSTTDRGILDQTREPYPVTTAAALSTPSRTSPKTRTT